MTQPTKRVVMLGNFPPPVGGAAMVNGAVHAALVASGVAVTRLDVSAPTLAHTRSLRYHVRRSSRNAAATLKLQRISGKDATLYIVPDAGLGAWYSAMHMQVAARSFGEILIHHHSCRYIDTASWPVAMLTRAAPDITTHVFLTSGMADAFQRRYGAVRHIIATNARFVSDEACRDAVPHAAGPLVIGHLSNLCADKGFFAVADAFERIATQRDDIRLMLAGPAIEDGVRTRIAELVRRHGDAVHHLGAVSGEAKHAFYAAIDVFLFPTQFAQEAAPLVLYEARAAGVPIVARDRGVIREIVPDDAGAVCDRSDDFSAFAAGFVAAHDWSIEGRTARSRAIKLEIRRACAASIADYAVLLQRLGGDPARAAPELHL